MTRIHDHLSDARSCRSVLKQISISCCLLLFASAILAFPRNGKIAFASDRDGNQEIYLMNADGTEQIRLTNNPGVDNFPEFSPDGKLIAYLSQRPPKGEFEIFLMNADGTNQRSLIVLSHWWALLVSSLSWSPEGDRIYFWDWGVSVFDVVALVRKDLFIGGLMPQIARDESRILLFGETGDVENHYNLYTANLKGGEYRFLPDVPNESDTEPSWSNSGNQIAFVVNDSSIYLADSDGTDRSHFHGTGHVYNYRIRPRWSPDDRKIVFAAGELWETEIFTKNVDGTGLTQLTNTEGSNFHPTWQTLRANVSISGRVITTNGRGLGNVAVSMVDSFGVRRTARTNSFGYYSFSDVPANTYTISVKSKQNQFQPRTVFADADMFDVDLVSVN